MNRREFFGALGKVAVAGVAVIVAAPTEKPRELTPEERLDIAAKQWEDAFRKCVMSKPQFALAC